MTELKILIEYKVPIKISFFAANQVIKLRNLNEKTLVSNLETSYISHRDFILAEMKKTGTLNEDN